MSDKGELRALQAKHEQLRALATKMLAALVRTKATLIDLSEMPSNDLLKYGAGISQTRAYEIMELLNPLPPKVEKPNTDVNIGPWQDYGELFAAGGHFSVTNINGRKPVALECRNIGGRDQGRLLFEMPDEEREPGMPSSGLPTYAWTGEV